MRFAPLLLLSLFVFQPSSQAVTFSSNATQNSLLELYTSEGCSSCPPADKWFVDLKDQEGLWTHFVPVVFHVSYWDYLGWKDIFASEVFTQRQERYAKLWQESSVYTPAIVLNGKAWRGWRQKATVPKLRGANVGTLSLESQDGLLYDVAFESRAKKNSGYKVHIALLGLDLQSDVKRGENRGRLLKHQFVVVAYQTERLNLSKGVFQAKVALEKPGNWRKNKIAVGAWVTQGNNPSPVQATGGYLPKEVF